MSFSGRGGIGRHDGLKIRCLVIVREGSSPSVPNNILYNSYAHIIKYQLTIYIVIQFFILNIFI